MLSLVYATATVLHELAFQRARKYPQIAIPASESSTLAGLLPPMFIIAGSPSFRCGYARWRVLSLNRTKLIDVWVEKLHNQDA